ncbi:hypothetical protein [Arthrobacter gengyunqii]|uniref:Uncharacterized protein n=1 Tax=Arthrobacter gengyunqii TaxID=2886940 RepID=A0ABS8GJ33_9MICC|nr:hypothetical protein [Arthrobacter gengyunqii]MCC3266580.1 hypothetical protein [Arthrobacter gengyunqii]
MLSASVSALISSGIASTGMIIWALIGLAGTLSGLITVRVARRRNLSAAPVPSSALTEDAAQKSPVSPDALTQAA